MNIFELTEKKLTNQGLRIDRYDLDRPWGGFFVIDENQAKEFANHYFKNQTVNAEGIVKLSPKILFVAPNKRLSWQYHHRRAEIWRCLEGPIKVSTSFTDEEADSRVLNAGDIITLKQGERHRLIGMDNWGVIAEIWQHTVEDNPSDEEDIVRLQDDFGR